MFNFFLRNNFLFFFCLFFNFIFFVSCIFSHPVTWKDGHSLMIHSDSTSRGGMYHYSLTPKKSFGAHIMYFDDTDDTLWLAQHNRLMKRWYGHDYQGNVYVLSGIGLRSQRATSYTSLHIGIQADWETQRWYTFFRSEYYALDAAYITITPRLGVAPYIAEFDALHTWFILELNTVHTKHAVQSTLFPTLRVFKDNLLIDYGHNFKNSQKVTFMLHL